jgi:hypothetical protein
MQTKWHMLRKARTTNRKERENENTENEGKQKKREKQSYNHSRRIGIKKHVAKNECFQTSLNGPKNDSQNKLPLNIPKLVPTLVPKLGPKNGSQKGPQRFPHLFASTWFRAAISELFTLTGGRIVHAKSFLEQVKCWLNDRSIAWCYTDILAAVTRLRSVQAHLRDYQRDVLYGTAKVPAQHASMASILNLIEVDANGEEDHDLESESSPPPLERLKIGQH